MAPLVPWELVQPERCFLGSEKQHKDKPREPSIGLHSKLGGVNTFGFSDPQVKCGVLLCTLVEVTCVKACTNLSRLQ